MGNNWKIVNSIKQNGVVVGYALEMEGFEGSLFHQPTIGLYEPSIIQSLYEAGYKIYDRDGNIKRPDGTPISELPSIDFSVVNMNEWQNAMANTDKYLTDAECAKYYTYDSNIEEVQFKTESSYEINTREEFIDYLNFNRELMDTVGSPLDNRPINSFVNPSALFSIDEIESNYSAVAPYLDIIHLRHQFTNYAEYKQVIEFLMENGVLNTPTPTPGEFIKAYYAWGPDGITGRCVDIRYKYNVDAPFKSRDDILPTSLKESYGVEPNEVILKINRKSVVPLLNRDQELRFLKHTNTLRDKIQVYDFQRDRLAIERSDAFNQVKRPDLGRYKYMPIAGVGEVAGLSDVSDRIYFHFISNTGLRYTYKVAHNGVNFYMNEASYEMFCRMYNFSICSMVGSIKLSLEDIGNETDYLLWNIAITETTKRVEEKKVKPIFNSTYELLTAAGMNTIDIAKYAINHIVNLKEQFPYNKMLFEAKYYEALNSKFSIQIFQKGLYPEIYQVFKLDPEEVKTWHDLIENADIDRVLDIRDKIEKGEIGPDDEDFDPTYVTIAERALIKSKSLSPWEQVGKEAELAAKMSKDVVNAYASAKCIIDIFNGDTNIDGLGQGIADDSKVRDRYIAASVYMSLVYAECGNNPTLEQGKSVIERAHEEYLDPNLLYRERNNAYYGCLADYCFALNKRANPMDVNNYIYITKLFKEVGYKEDDKVRPYAAEILPLDVNKDKALNNILQSINNYTLKLISGLGYPDIKPFDKESMYGGMTVANIMSLPSWYYTALLMFTVIASKDDGSQTVTKSIKLIDGKEITYVLPRKTYDVIKSYGRKTKKYTTVFDLNNYSYNEAQGTRLLDKTGNFNHLIINAKLTPWEVQPLPGFKIKMLSFNPSWYGASQLCNSPHFGLQLYQQGIQNNLIVKEGISTLEYDRIYPGGIETMMDDYNITLNDEHATVEDINERFFEPTEYEPMKAYKKKVNMIARELKDKGRTLVSIPLKQDVVYAEYAILLNYNNIVKEVQSVEGTHNLTNDLSSTVISGSNIDKTLNVKRIEMSIKRPINKVPTENVTTNDVINLFRLMMNGKVVYTYRRNIVIPYGKYVTELTDAEFNDIITNYTYTENGKHVFIGCMGIYELGE